MRREALLRPMAYSWAIPRRTRAASSSRSNRHEPNVLADGMTSSAAAGPSRTANMDAASRPAKIAVPPPARPCQGRSLSLVLHRVPAPAAAAHGLASLSLAPADDSSGAAAPSPPRQARCQGKPVTGLARLSPPRPLCCWLALFSSWRASKPGREARQRGKQFWGEGPW